MNISFKCLTLMFLTFGSSSGCTSGSSEAPRREYVITPAKGEQATTQTSTSNDQETSPNLEFISPSQDITGRGLIEIEVLIDHVPENATLSYYYVAESKLNNVADELAAAPGTPIFSDLAPTETLIEWDQTDLKTGFYYIFVEINGKTRVDRFFADVVIEVSD